MTENEPITEHVEMRTVTYFECRCCGASEDEEDMLLGSFAMSHKRPDGGRCTAEYRNDPTTVWVDLLGGGW